MIDNIYSEIIISKNSLTQYYYGLQVKEKYDSVARLWASLPTDAELLQRQSLTAEQMVRRSVCLVEVLSPMSFTW